MKRKALLMAAVVLLAGLAGCTTTSEQDQQQAENSLENNTHTFTKPAQGTDKVWSCIAHDKWTGSSGDEQLQCELVDPDN